VKTSIMLITQSMAFNEAYRLLLGEGVCIRRIAVRERVYGQQTSNDFKRRLLTDGLNGR
jgi:hypothetical protein